MNAKTGRAAIWAGVVSLVSSAAFASKPSFLKALIDKPVQMLSEHTGTGKIGRLKRKEQATTLKQQIERMLSSDAANVIGLPTEETIFSKGGKPLIRFWKNRKGLYVRNKDGGIWNLVKSKDIEKLLLTDPGFGGEINGIFNSYFFDEGKNLAKDKLRTGEEYPDLESVTKALKEHNDTQQKWVNEGISKVEEGLSIVRKARDLFGFTGPIYHGEYGRNAVSLKFHTEDWVLRRRWVLKDAGSIEVSTERTQYRANPPGIYHFGYDDTHIYNLYSPDGVKKFASNFGEQARRFPMMVREHFRNDAKRKFPQQKALLKEQMDRVGFSLKLPEWPTNELDWVEAFDQLAGARKMLKAHIVETADKVLALLKSDSAKRTLVKTDGYPIGKNKTITKQGWLRIVDESGNVRTVKKPTDIAWSLANAFEPISVEHANTWLAEHASP